MASFLSSYNPIKKNFIAIEHSEKENDTIVIGVEVHKKNDELDITRHFIVDKVSELSEIIKGSTKASLIITDHNILSKETSIIGTDQEILSEVYPNLNLDDFYYQILKTTKKSFVAICRKKYVDQIIDHYKKVNVLITSIDLGNLKSSSLISYIGDVELLTYAAAITFIDQEISSIVPISDTSETYEIEGVTIPSTHTLPFSSIIDTITNQTSISGNIDEKNAKLLKVFKESQFFRKTLQYGIGFLLVSLLINFFIFNSSYKKWQELQEEQQIYTTQKESIKKQQSIVSTKENIVNSILTTGFSKSSYYIDQIIQSQPTTIILTSFSYQPITKTIRSDKPIVLDHKKIQITGNSSEKMSFTSWIQVIESLAFVDQVRIINYGADKKSANVFEIAINLIDDPEK